MNFEICPIIPHMQDLSWPFFGMFGGHRGYCV